MDRDEVLILLGCYVICWITLLLVAKKSRSMNRVVLWHLIIQACYSLFFWISLSLPNHGGGALAIIVFWFLSLGAHFVVLLLQLILTILLRRRAG